MTANVREQISQNLSTAGVFLIAFAMVMREGKESLFYRLQENIQFLLYSLVSVYLLSWQFLYTTH